MIFLSSRSKTKVSIFSFDAFYNIDNLGHDVSIDERQEIEQTLSQFSQKFIQNENVVEIQKIKKQSKEKLVQKMVFEAKRTAMKSRQESFPATISFSSKQYHRPKTIMYGERETYHRNTSKLEVLYQNLSRNHPEKDEFENYMKAIKTARDNITNFQSRENYFSKYYSNKTGFESLPMISQYIQSPDESKFMIIFTFL